MYICEFNFDFAELLTIPGLLIMGGILLLLIALIIFIVSSRKSKKNTTNEEVDNTIVTNDNIVNENIESNQDDIINEPVSSIEPQVNDVVSNSAIDDMVNIKPIMEDMEPITPVIDPVEIDPITEEKSIDIVEPITLNDLVEPINDNNDTGSTSVIEPKQDMEINNDEPAISIYGGISPIINPVLEDKPKGIYGGADPMENTQTIPVIEPKKEYGIPVEEKEEPIIIPTPTFDTITPINQSINNEATIVEDDNETIVESNIIETKTEKEPKKDDDIEILDF